VCFFYSEKLGGAAIFRWGFSVRGGPLDKWQGGGKAKIKITQGKRKKKNSCTKKFWRKRLFNKENYKFFVYKLAWEFQYELLHFATNLPISERSSESVRFMKSSVTWFTSTADTWSQNVVEKNSNQILIFPIGWHFSDRFWTLQKICGSGFISWKK
jgi:hypothetical protein